MIAVLAIAAGIGLAIYLFLRGELSDRQRNLAAEWQHARRDKRRGPGRRRAASGRNPP